MRASCASNCARSACDASSAARTCVAQVVERAEVLVELALGRRRSRRAAPRGARRCAAARPARATTRCSSSRAASSSRCTSIASALVRSTSAACAALASAVTRDWLRRGLARLEQPALRRRQLLVGGALLGLDALDRLRAPRPRAAPGARSSSSAVRRSTAICSCLRETRSAASPAAVTCRSKPTIAFSWRCSSAWSDAIADSAAAMVMSSVGGFVAQPRRASRSSARRARAVP